MKAITKEFIAEKIQNEQPWLERGLVAIYEQQTDSEKQNDFTSVDNGFGFSAFDARSGSYYAKWILSGKNLSGKHLERARKMMGKYVGQLHRLAEMKAAQSN